MSIIDSLKQTLWNMLFVHIPQCCIFSGYFGCHSQGFTIKSQGCCYVLSEMCSERDSPLEPFVLPAPGQPELEWLICGVHLGPPVLTRKPKRPRVNSLVCDRAAAFCAAGPPEVLSRMSRPVTQAAERERELARARSQRLKQAARACQASQFRVGSPIEAL